MTHRSDTLRTRPRFLLLAWIATASAALALASANAQQDRSTRSDRSSGRDDSTQATDQSTQYQQRQRTDQSQNADRSNQDRASRSRGDSQDQSTQSSDRYQRQQGTDEARDQRSRSSSQQQHLGITFDQQRQGQNGLLVNDVQQGTAAAQAGLRAGDQIVAVDGRGVSSSQQFFNSLSGQSGRQVPLVIARNGRQYTIQLATSQVAADQGSGDTAWLGVFLQDSQDANQEGAQIGQVYPGGPAARAGLRPGDLITSVDGQQVRTSADLINVIENEQPGARAQLAVTRNNQQMNLTATLGSRNSFTWRGQGEDQYGGQQGGGQYGGGQYANGQHGGGQYGGSQQNPYGGQSGQVDHFGNLPPFAMQLEHERRLYEQNQRLESQIARLQDEVRQLREAVLQRR